VDPPRLPGPGQARPGSGRRRRQRSRNTACRARRTTVEPTIGLWRGAPAYSP
jgi:hypothetical protein